MLYNIIALAPAARQLFSKVCGHLPALVQGNKEMLALGECLKGTGDSMRQMVKAPKQAITETKKT